MVAEHGGGQAVVADWPERYLAANFGRASRCSYARCEYDF